jgi:hypothetical protein
MNAWDNLPNAKHIDRVLASLKSNPDAWGAAWGAAWDAARDAARDAAWDAARDAAWGAAWDAISALIAWDDSAIYLSIPLEAFPVLLSTTNHAAVLLYPAAIVFSKESEC